jgi:hypothetical protein
MTATRLTRNLAILLLLLTGAGPSDARILKLWRFDELVAESDVVAIIESIENVPAKDIFPFAGDAHPATDFAATNTRFKVAAILKANGEPLTELTVLHFNYSRRFPIVNGAHFVRFGIGPLQYEKRNVIDGKPAGGIVALQQQPVWLAFLKQREDGRFEPLTGHYDSALSFRELHTPSFYGLP